MAIKLPGPIGLFSKFWHDTDENQEAKQKYYTENPGYFTTAEIGMWDSRQCF